MLYRFIASEKGRCRHRRSKMTAGSTSDVHLTIIEQFILYTYLYIKHSHISNVKSQTFLIHSLPLCNATPTANMNATNIVKALERYTT
jgi:hypothetical protein